MARYFKNPNENVLDQVLRRHAIARYPAQEVEQGKMVAVEEGRKLRQIPFADRDHQGVVCHIYRS